MKLTEGQERAYGMVSGLRRGGLAVITGYAGSGKTTLLKAMCKSLGSSIVVTPTGKAAVRVRDATGLHATTIHRWLYAPVEDPDTGLMTFTRKDMREIETPQSGIVFVDEASMVGPDIWEDLRETCERLRLALVLIGDGFQLPPVQPRNAEPFSTMTEAFAHKHGAAREELTEIMRQAQESPVIRASMALRDRDPDKAFSELRQIRDHFLEFCMRTFRHDGVIIAHRNATRHRINARMREAFGYTNDNPQKDEPILVIRNNYNVELFNGEVVRFPGWCAKPKGQTKCTDLFAGKSQMIRFGGMDHVGEICTLAIEQLTGQTTVSEKPLLIGSKIWAHKRIARDGISHLHANYGYCLTAHKSQGSEWPYALVVMEDSIRLNDEDGLRWAYTAVTRASKNTALCWGTP